VIYKKFINPGAYSIFINQMKREGKTPKQINEIFDFIGDYARLVLQDGRQPRYKQVLKTEVALRNYFNSDSKYTRHLNKTIDVYEPENILEWFENHEDLEYFRYELGYSPTTFDRGVVEPLEEGTINFAKVSELTILIDLWEDSELGDFSVGLRSWYSGIVKRDEEE